jgi:hypothetical protein
MRYSLNSKFYFTLLALFILTGSYSFVDAQSMQLALEGPEWNNINVYPVTGRTGILVKQKLSFGEYKTNVVKRSWTKGSTVTSGLTSGIPTDHDYRKIITADHIKKKQTLSFVLQDSAGSKAEAYCVSDFKGMDFNIGNSSVSIINLLGDVAGIGGTSSSYFYVQIYTDEGDSPWHLILDNQAAQVDPKLYQAKLAKSATEFYTITSDSRVKSKKGKIGNMPFGSGGFQIRNSTGEPVAAVSMIDKGVVYLKPVSPEERIILASACTALLLQEQI